MYDDLSDEVGIFDFDEMANHLLEQGLEASPSELHGCLSGLLGRGARPNREVGPGCAGTGAGRGSARGIGEPGDATLHSDSRRLAG